MLKAGGEEREHKREQGRECLRSGCSRRGGGNDRDPVVEARVGLTGLTCGEIFIGNRNGIWLHIIW